MKLVKIFFSQLNRPIDQDLHILYMIDGKLTWFEDEISIACEELRTFPDLNLAVLRCGLTWILHIKEIFWPRRFNCMIVNQSNVGLGCINQSNHWSRSRLNALCFLNEFVKQVFKNIPNFDFLRNTKTFPDWNLGGLILNLNRLELLDLSFIRFTICGLLLIFSFSTYFYGYAPNSCVKWVIYLGIFRRWKKGVELRVLCSVNILQLPLFLDQNQKKMKKNILER